MELQQRKAGESIVSVVPFVLFKLRFVISDRLLFATTNHIERLDPALSRPGRMDVWVNFTNATKWQAEGIFKCFFPSRPSASSSSPPSSDEASSPAEASDKNSPDSRRKASSAHAVPILEEAEIAQLAKRFADAIPEGEMSVRDNFLPAVVQYLISDAFGLQVASLQGYLLKNKTRPRESVEEVTEWCEAVLLVWLFRRELTFL
jgi:chaperone BCS1